MERITRMIDLNPRDWRSSEKPTGKEPILGPGAHHAIAPVVSFIITFALVHWFGHYLSYWFRH
jgi:hypothetical protein